MAFPIDVGGAAIDGDSYANALNTLIDLTNPANLSGLITSVDVQANTNITGLRVGIFRLVSGTTYRCITSVAVGNVTAGSKQTFPVSLPVQAGDFIGCYFAVGRIEASDGIGSGLLYKAGEYIDPGDSAAYTLLAGATQSLYGQGIVRGWSSK